MNDEFTPATISQMDWNQLKGEITRLHQLLQIQQKEIDTLKGQLTKKTAPTGPKYRVVEFAPKDGRHYAEKIRTLLLITQDKAEVKQFVSDYWKKQPQKPYVEISIYLGQRRVYAYEL